MSTHHLSRRQFNAQCAAFALALPAISALARGDQATATSGAAPAAPTTRLANRATPHNISGRVIINCYHTGTS